MSLLGLGTSRARHTMGHAGDPDILGQAPEAWGGHDEYQMREPERRITRLLKSTSTVAARLTQMFGESIQRDCLPSVAYFQVQIIQECPSEQWMGTVVGDDLCVILVSEPLEIARECWKLNVLAVRENRWRRRILLPPKRNRRTLVRYKRNVRDRLIRGAREPFILIMKLLSSCAIYFVMIVAAGCTVGQQESAETLDADQRSQAIVSAATKLRDHYVIAEQGKMLYDKLLDKSKRGGYAITETHEALAQQLTADLREWSGDLHLLVWHVGKKLPPLPIADQKPAQPHVEILDSSVACYQGWAKISDRLHGSISTELSKVGKARGRTSNQLRRMRWRKPRAQLPICEPSSSSVP